MSTKLNTPKTTSGYSGLIHEIAALLLIATVSVITNSDLAVTSISILATFTARLILIDSWRHFKFYLKSRDRSVVIAGAGKIMKKVFMWPPLILMITIIINLLAVAVTLAAVEIAKTSASSDILAIESKDYPVIFTLIGVNLILIPLIGKFRSQDNITQYADPIVVLFSPILSLCLSLLAAAVVSQGSLPIFLASALMQLIFLFDFINKRSLYYLPILKLLQKVLKITEKR